MTEYIQVFTTIVGRDAAQKLADVVVGQRLAACVQIVGPISSTYWWNGNVEKSEEWLCIMKSRADLYRQLEATIYANHAYDVPEIVAVGVESGLDTYLKWMEGELKKHE